MIRGPIYFPYLRGKQNELLALQDAASRLAKHGGVLPVVEPVKSNVAALMRAGNRLAAAGVPFCIVTNPRVGQLAGAAGAVQSKLIAPLLAANAPIVPAFQLTNGATVTQLTTFLGAYPKLDVILVHWDPVLQVSQILSAAQRHTKTVRHVLASSRLPAAYVGAFSKGSRVTLADGFQVEAKNANYPAESFFSDAWHSHAKAGWSGFGDFLMVGDAYKDSGGPAYAVAVHLTHDQTNHPAIYCRHFVSDDIVGQANPGGKYLQAVAKLVKHVARKPSAWAYSTAIPEFKQHHSTGHYPGLGAVKRLSMRHHLELMMHLL
jgi:hypothetical protein